MKSDYALDLNIQGQSISEFMASKIEALENAEVQVEKEKLIIGYLKQINNHSRLLIDAAKTDLQRLSIKSDS